MSEFESYDAYCRFRRSIREGARFLLEGTALQFLAAVAKSSRSRRETLDTGTTLYRTQIAYDWTEWLEYDSENSESYVAGKNIVPCEEKRLRPLPDGAREGRVNPIGIPVFYGAIEEETAVAEVRPWIGSVLTVGRFELQRECHIVNCADNFLGDSVWPPGFLDSFNRANGHEVTPPSAKEIENYIWHNIDQAFSRPVQRDEDRADYAPTQILGELFRKEKFDGIVYRSSVGEGHNIALFDIEVARCVERKLAEVKSLKFAYDRTNEIF